MCLQRGDIETMRRRKTTWFATLLASMMALTMLGAAPAAAQEEATCKGGSADYWLENPWPAAFKVPYKFRRPNG